MPVCGNGRWSPRALLAVALLVCVFAGSAIAAPATPDFGPAIDPIPVYDGQDRCSPHPKPGVLAFQAMVLEAYPGTATGYITRECHIGGRSEHKEGRAWDWPVDASSEVDRAYVDDLVSWLTAADDYGTPAAMARRLGVMYLIWDRQIWTPQYGWRVYCVQKKRGCVDPDSGGVRSPHTDHVHFSFTWKGARRRATYHEPARSLLVDAVSAPGTTGFWRVGGNGSVFPSDAGWFGSRASAFGKYPIVAIAAGRSAAGYILLGRNGRVFVFGDAERFGSAYGQTTDAVAVETHPAGSGYWIASSDGRVFAFGDAPHLGETAPPAETRVVDLIATDTGGGYWLIGDDGRVTAFGDATSFSPVAVTSVVAGADGRGTDSLWLVTDSGKVHALGGAGWLGDSSLDPATAISDIVATPSGEGYRLIGAKGQVLPFGEAADQR